MFLFFLLALTVHKTQYGCLLRTEELTVEKFWLRKFMHSVCNKYHINKADKLVVLISRSANEYNGREGLLR